MIGKNPTKNKIDAKAQKLKGRAQKAVGEFQMKTGQTVKGGISKAKGELNERVADARLSFGKEDYDAEEGDDFNI